MAKPLNPPAPEAQLVEYELCTTDANHLETVIWTTAGILVTGSVAGIAFLGGTLPDDPTGYDVAYRGGIASLFIVLIWLWRRIVARWYSLQQMLYARIIEIEADLSLYKERYIHWQAEYARTRRLPVYPQDQEAVLRLTHLHVPFSVRQTVSWLTRVLLAVWFLFIVVHLAAMQAEHKESPASAKAGLYKAAPAPATPAPHRPVIDPAPSPSLQWAPPG